MLAEIVTNKTLVLFRVTFFDLFVQLFGTGKRSIDVSVLYPKQWTVTKTPGEGTLKSLKHI